MTLPCQAPGMRGLVGLAGLRCGKPAVYRTRLGQVVCEACGQRMKKEHEEGTTIFSMLRPGPFPLEPIDDPEIP